MQPERTPIPDLSLYFRMLHVLFITHYMNKFLFSVGHRSIPLAKKAPGIIVASQRNNRWVSHAKSFYDDGEDGDGDKPEVLMISWDDTACRPIDENWIFNRRLADSSCSTRRSSGRLIIASNLYPINSQLNERDDAHRFACATVKSPPGRSSCWIGFGWH